MQKLHFEKEENQMKKLNPVFITYKKQTKPLHQWAKEYGLSYNTLYARFKAGWSLNKAFTHPVQQRDMKTRIPHLAKKSGLSERIIRSRLSRGWSFEEATTVPRQRIYKHRGIKKKCEELGIPISTVRNRLDRGIPFEQAFEKSKLK